ncbi:hypothetical protein CSB45_04515 [candidate division KSB3 bacterium]|uniref:Uncharacterized protein n=1 Tax=candidate division KSB3 bacterium TaxID=2044937 RepID=A0A2G6E8E3_9BACT|nr:MAG: hypothetical protein CSB45_04515 [candidate division KSB3 bacterium]PIE30640.1 MAG: hypothetical protein CSA57_03100 [candidate division KSB3 bacterium]
MPEGQSPRSFAGIYANDEFRRHSSLFPWLEKRTQPHYDDDPIMARQSAVLASQPYFLHQHY